MTATTDAAMDPLWDANGERVKQVSDSTIEKAGIRPLPSQLEKGDVFRLLNLPDHFIVGLDDMAMTTMKSLPGFREIPKGVHFLWVQQPDSVSRCGYWFVTGDKGTVRVKQWDRYNEVLAEPTNQSEACDLLASLESVYPTLQPSSLATERGNKVSNPICAQPLWHTLAWAISPETLSRITGETSVTEYPIDSMDCAKSSSSSHHHHHHPYPTQPNPTSSNTSSNSNSNSNSINDGDLHFLFAQDLTDLALLDTSPNLATQASVADTSARVLALLHTSTTAAAAAADREGNSILAELQFAFLSGTLLANAACLAHWWDLVLKIVLRSYRLAASGPWSGLATRMLETVFAQLWFAEYAVEAAASEGAGGGAGNRGEGGGGGPDGERVLYMCKPRSKERLKAALGEYKRRLRELGAGGEVWKVFEELEGWLRGLGWVLGGDGDGNGRPRGDRVSEGKEEGVEGGDSEEEDDPPVVVELDAEGREVGLVRFED
ncbi:hypothetical protein MFIFM68171_11054 [Madurella fahalii]|uniref:Uncharacterized protein n=1 Tax=Madurella fahalii TaxID=1157608 RepID=A0ABQ0GT08_9PEZI